MNEQQADNKKNIFIVAVIIFIIIGAIVYWQKRGVGEPKNIGGEEKFNEVKIAGLENFSSPTGQETMLLAVYFSSSKFSADCKNVLVAERKIPKTTAVARAALTELFKGPTEAEKGEGYFTAIAPGVEIKGLVIENGIAKADFNEVLESGADNACKFLTVREQITRTLKQFSSVKDVVISINGKTEGILQPKN